MTRQILLAALIALPTPSLAEWMLDNGVAIVAPTANNSTMELLAISCGDPIQVEVYSRGGPVRPEPVVDDGAAADYFYLPGKVQARVDGQVFALVAAGSEAAVVLFGEGTAAQSHMADIDPAFVAALKTGTTLTLAFDVTPEANAADGTAHETMADFPLAGSSAALDAALASCS
jgi:hypothetical protein